MGRRSVGLRGWVFGATVASAALAAGGASAATPPQGVLLGVDPLISAQNRGGLGNQFREPSLAVLPTCNRVLWSSGDISQAIYGGSLVVGALFSGTPPTLPDIGGGGEVEPGAYKTAVDELPDVNDPANGLYAGANDATCSNGTLLESRFTVNGDQYFQLGGVILHNQSGFEDTQTLRIGDTSVMVLHELDEWSANPAHSCTLEHRQDTHSSTNTHWPWVRRSSSCGYGWDLNQAVQFDPGGNNGFDGPSAYADPFDYATGGDATKGYRTIYFRAGAQDTGNHIFRSDDGGASWVEGAATVDAWHGRFTSTPPSIIEEVVAALEGVRPHGTLFYANCEGSTMNVYWSYDRGATLKGPAQMPAPCGGDAYVATKAISRVATYSAAFDTVRVAYPTKPGGGPAGIAVATLTVPRGSAILPGQATPPIQVSAPPGLGAQFTAQAAQSSVERLQFIEPDTFEWGKAHPDGAPLPDTALLAWEENDMRCTTGPKPAPVKPSSPGGARYAVVNDASNWVGPASLALTPTGLPLTWPATADRKEHACPPFAGNDFREGAFFYRPDPTDDRLNYLAMWLQNDNVPGTGPSLVEHFNIVSITPPSPPFVKMLTLGALSNGAVDVSAEVTFARAASFAGVSAVFVYQRQQGDWRKLEDGCVHPTLTLDAAGTTATYRCTTHQHLGAQRIVAMVRPATFVAPPHPNPSACHPDMKVFCQEDAFFTSALHCDAPATGSATCTQPRRGPSCGLTETACASSADCCRGLSCDSGRCAMQVVCAVERATCRTDADCCSGLACEAGACVVPTCAGARCATPADCCGGLACTSGICAAPGCGMANGPCTLPLDCCDGFRCQTGDPDHAGTCVAECATQGAACLSSADCCAGLQCPTGQDHPTCSP